LQKGNTIKKPVMKMESMDAALVYGLGGN